TSCLGCARSWSSTTRPSPSRTEGGTYSLVPPSPCSTDVRTHDEVSTTDQGRPTGRPQGDQGPHPRGDGARLPRQANRQGALDAQVARRPDRAGRRDTVRPQVGAQQSQRDQEGGEARRRVVSPAPRLADQPAASPGHRIRLTK